MCARVCVYVCVYIILHFVKGSINHLQRFALVYITFFGKYMVFGKYGKYNAFLIKYLQEINEILYFFVEMLVMW